MSEKLVVKIFQFGKRILYTKMINLYKALGYEF
jgi:hypothetical protein